MPIYCHVIYIQVMTRYFIDDRNIPLSYVFFRGVPYSRKLTHNDFNAKEINAKKINANEDQ